MVSLPLGLACVAAATREAGHEAMLLDLLFQGEPQRAIGDSVASFKPDLIGISVRNIDDQDGAHPRFLLESVKEVMTSCRACSGAPIVLGGAGYSIFPESVLQYLGADMGIQGEGEAAFVALLKRLECGAKTSDVPGIYMPSHRIASRSFVRLLDSLPLPEPHLWIPRSAATRDLRVPIQSRRGCPMDCSFCSTAAIEGRPIRRRSSIQIVNWMAELRAAGYRKFSFVDNTFNLPPSYAKELCQTIIEARLDIDFWCIVYPKWVDEELVELMRRAGCSQISLGFESGSDAVLQSMNKRFNRMEVKVVSELFRAAGIARWGFLLLGGPGETRNTVEESLDFAESLSLETLKITVGLRIYPQTALARTAVAESMIGAEEDLLLPRFYLASSLRKWLPERVAEYKASHSCG